MPRRTESRRSLGERQYHPSRDYDEGYDDGYDDGFRKGVTGLGKKRLSGKSKPKRKLSAWNKFVKANSKKPRFILRSGKLNLKKMGVAFRKTPASRKK